MKMLRLHQLGDLVLVNPAHIQMVLREDNNCDKSCETMIRLSESDWFYVDESVEDIDRLIALS